MNKNEREERVNELLKLVEWNTDLSIYLTL